MIFLKYYKIFLFCTLIKVNEKLINYIAYLLNLFRSIYSLQFKKSNFKSNFQSYMNHQ